MKIVSVSRSAGDAADARRRTGVRRAIRSPPLNAPSWAPSKLVLAIEAITTAAEPGTVAQWTAAESGWLHAEPAVLDAEPAELGEHPEVDREDLAAFAPLLDPEQRHHRQRVGAVDEVGDRGRRAGRGRRRRRRCRRRRPPARRRPSGRSRPASGRAARGSARWAGRWPAIARERPPHRAADRAPRVERPEDVAEHDAEEREAEPGGDEEEGQREVAIGRFGAAQPGVDRRPRAGRRRSRRRGSAPAG